jgi:hypothetical protein
MDQTVFKSRGPFRGISPYRHQVTFEEFDKSLEDVDDPDAAPPEWGNSGWSVNGNGDEAGGDHLRVIGEGVLMVYAGGQPNTGLQARHDTRNRLTGAPGTPFQLPFYKWAVWQAPPEPLDPLAGYNLHFGTEITVSSSGAWASDAAIGLSYDDADDDILPDDGSAVTCGPSGSWSGSGGAMFRVDRAGSLNLHVCNGETLSTRQVSIASSLSDGFHVIRVGLRYVTTATAPGDGTMQGYYQLVGNTPLAPVAWTRLGPAITGTLFPTATTASSFVVEVQNGPTAQEAWMAADWVASAVTKEAAVATF